MQKLQNEQELLMNLADMLIEVYVAESALLRVEKLIGLRGEAAVSLQRDAAVVYLHRAVEKVAGAGREALVSFAEGDELNVMLLGLKRFTKITPLNLTALRRRLAAAVLESNGYPF